MGVLKVRLKHLKQLVLVAIGTGLRKQELLMLRRDQLDLSRNLLVTTNTKGKRNREIPHERRSTKNLAASLSWEGSERLPLC
ncbi:MAG: tyrosine-type recombinase/integrase [Pyrinomonadaceae bacterium]